MRINIVLLKYNALYFTYPLEKQDFIHIILPSCFAFYRRLAIAWTISQNSRNYKASRPLITKPCGLSYRCMSTLFVNY